MAHTTKKMKLKRTMREVLDDEASAMSVEEELMNNVVKEGVALKKAYGAALRLGADLAAGDEPRLCGLLHDLSSELATV